MGGSTPLRVERSRVGLEADLEDWIERNPTLLAEGFTVVGRQVHVAGGFIDLLCLDVQGRWVVVELKRERLYREAVAQGLDYAACVGALSGDDLRDALSAAWARRREWRAPTSLVDEQLAADSAEGRDVRVLVAGTGVDPGLERVVELLARYEVPVSVVSFQVFDLPGGGPLLVREVVEEDRPVRTTARDAARSLDSVRERAVAAGVVGAFDEILGAADAAGLALRPYVRSVMIAPPTQRNRFLAVVTPEPGRGMRIDFGPEAFAEFFDGLTAEDVEAALGPPGYVWYAGPDLAAVADRMTAFFSELPELTDMGDARADAPTVKRLAQGVRPGEWTSYGDLSTAAIGRPSAAMSIGTMASRVSDFPNPHRVLNSRGAVPAGWRDDAGAGPEECRRRLEAEGIRFGSDGHADPSQRVGPEELKARAGSMDLPSA